MHLPSLTALVAQGKSFLICKPGNNFCYYAVHVNGKEQDLGLDATLPSGLMVSYLNNTVPDGTLWFKPGELTLPQVQINTPRYAADHICRNHDTAMSYPLPNVHCHLIHAYIRVAICEHCLATKAQGLTAFLAGTRCLVSVPQAGPVNAAS